MRPPFSAVLLACWLAACSPEPGEQPSDDTADGASDQPPPPSTTDAPEEGPAPEAEDADGFSSSYTKLDLESCKVLDQSEGEGSWIEFRCNGLQGVPLFVSEGDGRFDLDAGVKNEDFATIMAFNDVGETVEWRRKDGEPFAVIFRYRDVSMESGPRTVLAVEKIGTRVEPGCRVAQIAGETRNANSRARRIADSLAVDFDCSQEPQYVGNAR